jgi:hypothetical protein
MAEEATPLTAVAEVLPDEAEAPVECAVPPEAPMAPVDEGVPVAVESPAPEEAPEAKAPAAAEPAAAAPKQVKIVVEELDNPDLKALIDKCKSEAIEAKLKVWIAVYTGSYDVVAFDKVPGTPGMMEKVNKAKAISCLKGEKLTNPSMPMVMCVLMPKFMCGLGNMPVMGTLRIAVADTGASCITVNGAPGALADLGILERALAKTGFTKNTEDVYVKTGEAAPPDQNKVADQISAPDEKNDQNNVPEPNKAPEQANMESE